MEANRRKEIEARLLKLITESEKPKESKVAVPTAAQRSKVIRRRKGNPDHHIA